MEKTKLFKTVSIISAVAVTLAALSVVGAVKDVKKYEEKETVSYYYSPLENASSATTEDYWASYDATMTETGASVPEGTVGGNSGQIGVSGNGNSGTAVNNPGPAVDVSNWDKTTIVAKLREAVTKTKAYSGNITVNHSEEFTANVTECTGGALGAKVANYLVGSVVKPSEEVYSYKNGRTTTAEGENVEMLLPKNGPFTLNPAGASSATVAPENGGYVIRITIVSETVGMTDKPVNNAASIGYLDVASINTSYMTVTDAKIQYLGSTIEAHINNNGYVTRAVYNIPLHVYGAAEALGINGQAVFDGNQMETWIINW